MFGSSWARWSHSGRVGNRENSDLIEVDHQKRRANTDYEDSPVKMWWRSFWDCSTLLVSEFFWSQSIGVCLLDHGQMVYFHKQSPKINILPVLLFKPPTKKVWPHINGCIKHQPQPVDSSPQRPRGKEWRWHPGWSIAPWSGCAWTTPDADQQVKRALVGLGGLEHLSTRNGFIF